MPYAAQHTTYRRPRLKHHERHTCTCGALLVGIRMIKKDGTGGSIMPCHDEITSGDGRKNLVVLDERGFGHLVVKAAPAVRGREVHWGNCSQQERYERK